MPDKAAGPASEQLQQLKRRLDEWRGSQAPRARLPEELWAAAVELAGQQGLYRVAKVLRLDYAALKKRTAITSSTPVTAPPPFIELLNPAGAMAADCLIELEGASGGGQMTQKKINPPAEGAPVC